MGENPQSMMPENSGSFPFFHPVSKLIKGPIQIIGPEATASDCARKMSEASIGSLVVIAQHSMIGIVTSTDLVEKVLALKKKRRLSGFRNHEFPGDLHQQKRNHF